MTSIPRRRRGSSKSEDTPTTAAGTTDWTSAAPSASSSLSSAFDYDDNKENMGRDRTGEFQSALRSLQGRAQIRQIQPNSINQFGQKANRNLEQYSQFMQIARNIGTHITGTYSKLEKLALLAKRKSLFDDKSSEISDLTFIIKEDINALNKDIAKLLSIAKGNQRLSGKHLQSHSSGVVVGLQSKLASMSNEFKQVLQVRTETLKEQRNRQDQFSKGPVAASLPPSALKGHYQGSVLLADEGHGGDDVSIFMGEDSSLLRNRQNQLVMQDETADTYLTERADTMKTIESTIVELGGIFNQLATMVKEQEEVVRRIDGNIEVAEMNVEAAHSELLKYFKSVTSNRWLMLKVFGVLIFFFVIFILFMA